MTPVSIVVNELYEAFNRGMVKCEILFPAGNQSLGLTAVPARNARLTSTLAAG